MTPMTGSDFIDAITKPKTKRHVAEAGWPQRTLCGHPSILRAHMDGDEMKALFDDWVATWPPCKQCAKSKQRRIDGRPT